MQKEFETHKEEGKFLFDTIIELKYSETGIEMTARDAGLWWQSRFEKRSNELRLKEFRTKRAKLKIKQDKNCWKDKQKLLEIIGAVQ